jgi:DNA-binding transcriptional LysR family regulator
MSQERITSAAQGIELVASGQAIATVPVSMAEGFAHPGIVGVPVVDAGPASLALVWRTNQENPLVDALVRIAEAEVDGGDRAPAL